MRTFIQRYTQGATFLGQAILLATLVLTSARFFHL
jgi:hypothetical protein